MLMALTPRSANFLDQFLFVERIEQAGVDGAGLEQRNFLHRRLAQAQHDVAGADERLAVGGNRRAGFGVGFVGKTGGEAEAGLDFHLRAEFDQLGGAVRRQRCPGFARMRFFGNGNLHFSKNVARTVSHPFPAVNSNVAILCTGIVAPCRQLNELFFKILSASST